MDSLARVERIEHAIVLVRGQRVILDADLAVLYGVSTKALKQAVRRNAARFPKDFMFQVEAEEARRLRSQFVTLDADGVPARAGRGRHAKYAAFAFTEQGVAMLSSVLRSPRAIQVNIAIVRTFVRLRQMLLQHADLARRLGELERGLATHDSRIREIFAALRQLMEPPEDGVPRKPVGFR